MPYNSNITRSADAVELIPEVVEREIFQAIPQASCVMTLARRLRDMSTHETKLRIVDGLATAYFAAASDTCAAGDTGRLQTSEVTWDSVTLRAAKLGVVVPIPRDVFDDVEYDLWAEIKPIVVEAFGLAFDQAVLYGTNSPTDWPNSGAGLVDLISNESQTVDYSTQLAAGDDLYTMILGDSGVVSLVEEKGFAVNGHLCSLNMRGRLRGCRTSTGVPVFTHNSSLSPADKFKYAIDGEPAIFPVNGSIDSSTSLDICGDWSKLVYSLRKGLEFQILTEASIYDNSGTLQYALAQDDLVALKAVMRLGWQLPRPDNRLDSSTPLPFAALVP